jgi:hypothetical protein
MFAFRKQLCIRHVAATRQQEAMWNCFLFHCVNEQRRPSAVGSEPMRNIEYQCEFLGRIEKSLSLFVSGYFSFSVLPMGRPVVISENFTRVPLVGGCAVTNSPANTGWFCFWRSCVALTSWDRLSIGSCSYRGWCPVVLLRISL